MKLVARLSTAAVLAGFIAAAPASAQNIAYSGNTLGCFYTSGMSCTPVVNAILGNLSFQGNTFSGTTQSGFGAIGNLATSDNNLGTFSLPGTNDPRNFDTEPANFLLFVKWITPGDAVPLDLPYTAMLDGVLGATSGGVTVLFTSLPTYVLMASGLAGLMMFGKRRRNHV